MQHAFELVLIDPPFITEDVWRAYGRAAAFLLNSRGADSGGGGGGGGGAVIATTVRENEPLLAELFGPSLRRQCWQPSIPNLVYQYETFANFACPQLAGANTELPPLSDY